jgi:hypothetical protein
LGFLILIWSLDYKSTRAVYYAIFIIFILGIFYSKFYINHFAKNEIFEQKDNFHWVNKRYQFIYKSIATNLNKEFDYEFVLLKNLTQFLKNEFDVDKVPNIENFGHPNYNPAYVMKLLKLRRYDNIKTLVDMCFIERYYYYLLKDDKIKINFLHDSIFY